MMKQKCLTADRHFSPPLSSIRVVIFVAFICDLIVLTGGILCIRWLSSFIPARFPLSSIILHLISSHSLCLFPYLSRVISIRTDQSKVVRSVQVLRFSQQLCIQNAHSDDRQITKKRLATLFIQILAKFTA